MDIEPSDRSGLGVRCVSERGSVEVRADPATRSPGGDDAVARGHRRRGDGEEGIILPIAPFSEGAVPLRRRRKLGAAEERREP